jgi:hypothetical protein
LNGEDFLELVEKFKCIAQPKGDSTIRAAVGVLKRYRGSRH